MHSGTFGDLYYVSSSACQQHMGSWVGSQDRKPLFLRSRYSDEQRDKERRGRGEGKKGWKRKGGGGDERG